MKQLWRTAETMESQSDIFWLNGKIVIFHFNVIGRGSNSIAMAPESLMVSLFEREARHPYGLKIT